MAYVIGVDGGGTGCRAAVAHETGAALARATGGPANIATDLPSARHNIISAVHEAFDKAGIARSEISQATAVLGLAGANLGDYAAQLHRSLPFARAEIVSDGETTLTGAIGEAEGCVAAIGTGSVFGWRGPQGFSQIGGWGFLLGDGGSGARLGRDFLSLALLACDGIIPHSFLTREIMAEFDNEATALVAQAMAFTPGDFGRYAPRIVAAAAAGDENAENTLAQHTDIVRKSIDAAGFTPAKAFCMLGGLGPIYLARLEDKYQKAARTPLGSSLEGAVILAQKLRRGLG